MGRAIRFLLCLAVAVSLAAATAGRPVLAAPPALAAPAAADAAKESPGAKPSAPGEPTLYLSWGAPWGMRGARESLTTACDDTARVDTLYLTFDPGRDSPVLGGMSATLYFWAQAGDTLGSFWHLGQGTANAGNCLIEFTAPPTGCPSPFKAAGVGFPKYRHDRDAGLLEMIYAVPRSQAAAVSAGTRYFLARVMLRHRRADLAGCAQSICVEWASAKLGFGRGFNPEATTGHRFITWNPGGGAGCGEHTTKPASAFDAPRPAGADTAAARGVPLQFQNFRPATGDTAKINP